MGDQSQQQQRLDSIGDYVFERTVGQGQFGKVKLATHKPTGVRVAIKVIHKLSLTPDTLRMVQREVTIMKMLHHPNIIRLYEVIESDTHLFIVMEYAAGGEVMDLIMAHGRLKEREACRFFSQTAWALAYCHSRHTVHRDVKAENLLLDEHMNIKLIDFGLSNVFTPGSTLKTFCGSPTYASPELVQRHEYTGPEVDCWSLGVLLYVLVCGELPFDGSTFLDLYRKIIEARFRIPSHVSPLCRDLIQRMLVSDSRRRATIDQICSHPWVLEGGFRPPDEFTITQEAPRERVTSTAQLDVNILQEMERAMGFTPEVVAKSVCGNLYDDVAATYYLLRDSQSASGFLRGAIPSSASVLPGGPPTAPILVSVPTPTVTAKPTAVHEDMDIEVSSPVPTTRNRSATHAGPDVTAPSTSPPPTTHTIAHEPKMPVITLMASAAASGSTAAASRPKAKGKAAAAAPKYATMKTPGSKRIKSGKTKDIREAATPTPTFLTPRGESPASSSPEPPRKSIDLTRPEQPVPEDDWVIVEALPASDLSSCERERYDEISRKVAEGKRPGPVGQFFASVLGGKKEPHAPKEPRSVRFAFSVHMTSTKPPAEMMDAIRRVLSDTNPPIEFSAESEFCLKCSDPKARVQFEIEICRLPQLSVNGLRFHRLRGDSWRYKNLCKELLSLFHL